jgi:hypothetical protein
MPSRLQMTNAERCTAPPESEAVARAAVDSLVGGNMTDAEWARQRARLLEFVIILRSWDRQGQPRLPGI